MVDVLAPHLDLLVVLQECLEGIGHGTVRLCCQGMNVIVAARRDQRRWVHVWQALVGIGVAHVADVWVHGCHCGVWIVVFFGGGGGLSALASGKLVEPLSTAGVARVEVTPDGSRGLEIGRAHV